MIKQRLFAWQKAIFGLALIAVSLLGNLALNLPASAAPGRAEVYTLTGPDTIQGTGGYFVDVKYNFQRVPGTNDFKGGVHVPEYDYNLGVTTLECDFDITIHGNAQAPTSGTATYGTAHNCTSQPSSFQWSPITIIKPGDPTGVNSAGFGAGPAGATAGDAQATCLVDSFTWLICPLISVAQAGVQKMEEWVKQVLQVTPLDNSSASPLYKAWSAMRNLADVFFILIFFFVIFGTGIGLDNYSVKKILPRLMAAAVLVQFSYIICGIVIDVSNVLGLGMSQLIGAAIPGTTAGNDVITQTFGGMAAILLVGTGGAIVITAGLLVPILLAVLSALLSLIAAYLTLEVRVLLIYFLVVVSPFAFVLWVLPNTEQYFKKWWEFLSLLALMFPIIMLILSVANLFSYVTAEAAKGGQADELQTIIGAIIPILAFFLIPATFKLAGSVLMLGHNLVTSAAGRSHKGIGGMVWGKDQQEQNRARGLEKRDRLREKPAPTTTLGKIGRSLNTATANTHAGFGPIVRKGTIKANRLESAMDKALNDKATSQAMDEYRSKYGKPDYDQTLANRKAGEMDKLLDKNAANAFLNQEVKITAKDGTVSDVKIKNVNLDEVGIPALTAKVTDALNKGDHATAIAAMTKLSQSQSGEDALQQLREVGGPNGFGGNYDVGVTNEKLKDVWAKGTANAKSPDFKKPPASAWSDLSAEEITTMSSKQVSRALKYYNDNLDNPDSDKADKAKKAAEQFSANFQKVLDNPNTASKINPNSVDAVLKYGIDISQKDATKNGTSYTNSTSYKNAVVAAAHYTRPATINTQTTTPPPPQTQPTQPNVGTNIGTPLVNVSTPIPSGARNAAGGAAFNNQTLGGLYIPRTYQPPTNPNPSSPKVDPAVEEHRDDRIGDDRSIS